MIICNENKSVIDDLYIHDSIFTGFNYDYINRKVYFVCENPYLNKKFDFKFHNVLLLDMQSCSFWHGGNRILDIFIEESTPRMNELFEIQKQYKELYEGSYLDQKILYLQIKFQINSGDVLLIICEYIEFEEQNI